MLDDRVLYLINADIDGELGPGEQSELAAILEQSAEARALRAEWLRLANTLEALPPAEPPPELAADILARVRLPQGRGRLSLAGFWERLQPVPVAAGFAAGALLTLGVAEWAGQNGAPADVASMVGTMVANPDAAGPARHSKLALSGPDFSGTVAMGEQGSFVVLEFVIESAGSAEIFVDLADTGLRFGGIAHEWAEGPSASEQLQVSGGTVRVVNQGRQSFSMFLSRTASGAEGDRSIRIGVSTDGETGFSGTLNG